MLNLLPVVVLPNLLILLVFDLPRVVRLCVGRVVLGAQPDALADGTVVVVDVVLRVALDHIRVAAVVARAYRVDVAQASGLAQALRTGLVARHVVMATRAQRVLGLVDVVGSGVGAAARGRGGGGGRRHGRGGGRGRGREVQ